MKKLSGMLALLLLSTAADAAVTLSYDGHFVPSLVYKYNANDHISGQFTFDPGAPDSITPIAPTTYDFGFTNNTSSSWAVNNGVPTIINSGVGVSFENDTIVIGGTRRASIVAPGVYDEIIVGSGQISPSAPVISDIPPPRTAIELAAYFPADTFAFANIQNLTYEQILALKPLFLTFTMTDGYVESFGGVDHYSITTVPLPGAAWLFGSAIAGLALRKLRTS